MDKGGRSVHRTRKSFAVGASPYNAVKLTLGITIAVGVLMVLIVGKLATSPLVQILLLVTYGIGAAGVLVAKTRRVAQTQTESGKSFIDKSSANVDIEQ